MIKVKITEKWGHFYLRRWRVLVTKETTEDGWIKSDVLSGSAFTWNGAIRMAKRLVKELEND